MRNVILFTIVLAGTAFGLDQGFEDIFTAQSDYPFSYFLNPAAFSVHKGVEFYSSISYPEEGSQLPNYTDLSLKLSKFLGISYRRRKETDELPKLGDFALTSGFGLSRGLNFGATWEKFDNGDPAERGNSWHLGLLSRPHRYVSLGIVARDLWTSRVDVNQSYSAGLGLRPLTDRLSLYADARWLKGERLKDVNFYYGAFVEPFDGVTIGTSYRNKDNFGFSLGFNLRHFGLGTRVRSIGKKLNVHPFVSFSSTIKPTHINEGSYVAGLKLKGDITNSGSNSIIFGSKPSIRDYIDALHVAQKDPAVKGVFIKYQGASMNWALIEELRFAIKECRASGKKVVMYMESAGMKGYYLATACDKIVLCPEGGLVLKGLSMGSLHFKGLLKRAKIKVQLARQGKYKSAAEMVTKTKISKEAREDLLRFLGDVDREVTGALAKRVRLTRKQFAKKFYSKVMFFPDEAKQMGLIDGIMYEDDAKKLAHSIAKVSGKGITNVSNFKYYDRRWDERPVIIVVNAEGSIMSGKSGNSIVIGRVMGSESMVSLLKKAGRIGNCKGIILRVDSGGGEGLASDLIREATRRLRRQGKRVVVSMGGIAASGGYLISMSSERIFVDKLTLTGSIGVISFHFSVEELAKWAGVTTDNVSMAPHASMFSMFKNLTPEQMKILKRSLNKSYKLFVNQVARERKLNPTYVDSIAQGHIWTGPTAKKLKLVDEVGGLDQAIRYIARKAKLKNGDYRVIYLPKSKSILSSLLSLPREISQVRSSLFTPFRFSNQVLFLCPHRLK